MSFSADQAATLLGIARGAIAERLGGPPLVLRDDAWLQEKRAVFVTLHEHGELRGCVGQLEARFPLEEAVREAARSAAFRDGRFPPVQPEELDALEVEISVLSPMEPLEVKSEEELLRQLRPGVDGVVLSRGPYIGVFIPEMWKQLPEPREFLYYLKRKAGLPADRWLPGTRVERFTAELVEAPRVT